MRVCVLTDNYSAVKVLIKNPRTLTHPRLSVTGLPFLFFQFFIYFILPSFSFSSVPVPPLTFLCLSAFLCAPFFLFLSPLSLPLSCSCHLLVFCIFLLMSCFFFFCLSFSFLPRLQEDPPTGVSGAPSENNIMLWNAVIFG